MAYEAIEASDIAIADDLSRSGLKPQDLRLRVAGGSEKAACGAPGQSEGYIIPYFTLYGQPTHFYRMRVLEGDSTKYRQTGGMPNFVYFPPHLRHVQEELELLPEQKTFKHEEHESPRRRCIIVTEGEKKAVKAVKEGFLTCALGGVDSWRTRTLLLPKDTKVKALYGKNKGLQVKLPGSSGNLTETWNLATGMEDLVNYAVQANLDIVIIFDRDTDGGLKFEVKRAAASLGYALRVAGMSSQKVRLAELPAVGKAEKVGLDDYLVHEGADALDDLLEEVLNNNHAFPTHPNPRGYITNILNRGVLTREQAQNVSYAVLTELDARGRRMYDKATRDPFYFDEKTLQLMPATLLHRHGAPMHETVFGQFLYQNFGVMAGDGKLLSWLAAQLTGEEPTEPVDPRRTIATLPDGIAVQISDSQFIFVKADPRVPFQLCSNGTYGVMFERGQVEPIDGREIIQGAMKELQGSRGRPLKPKWLDVLQQTNIQSEAHQSIGALLFYISPWFLRWRGLQLPVEVYVGEPGSGKSSLSALRLQIMTGRPTLRNVPNDVRDWNASITNSGGLHVIDNVHLTNKELRQRLSDEICQPLDANVLTPQGFKPMGSMQVGDEVLTPEGKIASVGELHTPGIAEVYKVTFTDGSSTECTMDHKWEVYTRDDIVGFKVYQTRTLSLKEIMHRGLRYAGKNKRCKWYIPTVSDLRFDPQSTLEIDPYLLGVLLGDGNLSSRQIFIGMTEQEIIDEVTNCLPVNCSLGTSQKGSYYLRGSWQGLKKSLGDLGLIGTKSHTKFIPDSYKLGSPETRLALLQGLMDTDGTVKVRTKTAIYSTVSKDLADGVQFIVQSLGGRSNMYRRADGAYQVSVSLPDQVPFRLSGKKDLYAKRAMSGRRAIKSVEHSRTCEVKCITLQDGSGLYITDNFLVTHNCRVITEPDPHVEMRSLYTTADVLRIPVRCTFAVTAIASPFQNPDFLQRSLIFKLQRPEDANPDSEWGLAQLKEGGGRAGWLAHHLAFTHKFLKAAVHEDKWNPKDRVKHRLVHFEMAMKLAAEIVGINPNVVNTHLVRMGEGEATTMDWALEGLAAYVDDRKEKGKDDQLVSAKEIAEWCLTHPDYQNCDMLNNSRRLGRYLSTHQTYIRRLAGLKEEGTKDNRKVYSIVDPEIPH